MKNKTSIIPSVNFHLWEPCNMRCKFCFAGFKDVKKSILPKGHLKKEDSIELVKQLGSFGFEKITFAGGEPTLCPWLNELVTEAKRAGMTTMLVTNGSCLTQEYLEKFKGTLDWIVLSIDSLDPETNKITGRQLASIGARMESPYALAQLIKRNGFRFKVNTVVHRYNIKENMDELILELNPERWKILKVLSVADQNGASYSDFEISDGEFQEYLKRNSLGKKQIAEIGESNDDMRGTYIMIDPAGRFFDNVLGKHRYSEPILSCGIELALRGIEFDLFKFKKRGGKYDW